MSNGNTTIDLTRYVAPIRFGGHHGIVLAAQLVVAAPADLGVRGRASLTTTTAKADRVQLVLNLRAKTTVGGLRSVIVPFDAAWGAMLGRLASAARLPSTGGDIGARAQAIVDAVLIDGLAFLVNDAETKYAESARRLTIIAERALEHEIEHVAGAGFLEAVRAAHAALGEAIGVGETPVRFARAELQVAVGELAQAIADYALQVAAETDREDAASVHRFRAAMMPIDRFRAGRSPVSEEADTTVAPVSPSPIVEPLDGAPLR